MPLHEIGSFTISQQQSDTFAQASGDFNPLHVDPIRARRYQFGSTVIHGVCGTIKAIDMLLEHFDYPVIIESINVQFNKPIRHDYEVTVSASQISTGAIRIETRVDGSRTQIIDIQLSKMLEPVSAIKNNTVDKNLESACLDINFSQASKAQGEIDLIWNDKLIEELFPQVKEKLPDYQVALLLGLTKIVGMKCPGLNSVFGRFSVEFKPALTKFKPNLSYATISSDERFNRLISKVSNDLAEAEIETFLRPPPVRQAAFELIKPLVKAGEFSQQNALIIGGSRGIGEITAKLIAAGGGHPIITYSKGKAEAEQVVAEINDGGGHCGQVQYDVLSPDTEILNCFADQEITHIYYFASPIIEKGDQDLWSEKTFAKYCTFYLSGLVNLLNYFINVADYRRNRLNIFIPSTIFIDQPLEGFSEYIAAKAAAEKLVGGLRLKYPTWSIKTPRLPRMLTDQTSSVATEDSLYAVDVVLQHLR